MHAYMCMQQNKANALDEASQAVAGTKTTKRERERERKKKKKKKKKRNPERRRRGWAQRTRFSQTCLVSFPFSFLSHCRRWIETIIFRKFLSHQFLKSNSSHCRQDSSSDFVARIATFQQRFAWLNSAVGPMDCLSDPQLSEPPAWGHQKGVTPICSDLPIPRFLPICSDLRSVFSGKPRFVPIRSDFFRCSDFFRFVFRTNQNKSGKLPPADPPLAIPRNWQSREKCGPLLF